MVAHPVQLHVLGRKPRERIHVLIRLLLLCGLLSLGHGSLYFLAYWLFPVTAALLVAQHGPRRYIEEDVPVLAGGLRWIAGACGYLWLLSDRLPEGPAPEVECDISAEGTPTVRSALLRLVLGIPALIVVLLLSIVGAFVWIAAAIVIVVTGLLPTSLGDILAAILRYQLRFAAYQLSLVERYPFLADDGLSSAPHAGPA